MSIFHFYLGKSRYCVRCLSIANWQAGYDIHDFCCCHLRCWWSLFGEYCVRTSIVFYNITSEYNSKCIIPKCINSAKIATLKKKQDARGHRTLTRQPGHHYSWHANGASIQNLTPSQHQRVSCLSCVFLCCYTRFLKCPLMITVHPRINLESNVSKSIFANLWLMETLAFFRSPRSISSSQLVFCAFTHLFFWKTSWLPSHHNHQKIYLQNASSGKPATR